MFFCFVLFFERETIQIITETFPDVSQHNTNTDFYINMTTAGAFVNRISVGL